MPEGSPHGPLLLDTHIWLWLMEGIEREIARPVTESLRAVSRSGDLLVSAISIWEVALLESKSRVRLSIEIDEWVRRGSRAPGLRVAGLSPEILIDSTRLPGRLHGDPADRMIVATARRTGATLVTRDQRILDYAGSGSLSVIDATP